MLTTSTFFQRLTHLDAILFLQEFASDVLDFILNEIMYPIKNNLQLPGAALDLFFTGVGCLKASSDIVGSAVLPKLEAIIGISHWCLE